MNALMQVVYFVQFFLHASTHAQDDPPCLSHQSTCVEYLSLKQNGRPELHPCSHVSVQEAKRDHWSSSLPALLLISSTQRDTIMSC